MEHDCIFCRIARGELPSQKVWEDDSYLVFRDINPAAPVHLLAIPKAHRARLAECGQEDKDLLGGLLLAAGAAAAKENLGSFRLIVNNGADAGQTVFHLHAHVLGGKKMAEKLL